MPTFDRTNRFNKDFSNLDDADQDRFRERVKDFIEDLKVQQFRRGLRVKGVHGAPGVLEMTWAPNGRATFQIGDERHPGEPHIIWRRVGTHEIFKNP